MRSVKSVLNSLYLRGTEGYSGEDWEAAGGCREGDDKGASVNILENLL